MEKRRRPELCSEVVASTLSFPTAVRTHRYFSVDSTTSCSFSSIVSLEKQAFGEKGKWAWSLLFWLSQKPLKKKYAAVM